MKLIITVRTSEEEKDVYLEDVVFPQILEGYLAGHTDSEHNWEMKSEEED